MQLKDSMVHDAGRRVQGFLDSERAALGTIVPETLRTQLDTAVAQVDAFQLEQATLAGTSKGETANQEAMRQALYVGILKPIAGVTRFALKKTPDFTTLVVAPHDVRKIQFVTKVTAVAECAAKHEALFVQHGLPADFIAQLRAAVTQISASTETRALQVGRLAASRKGIDTSIAAIREVIRVLDRVLTPALRKNPPLLANWVASKRIKATAVTPLPTGDAGTPANATPTAQPAVEPPKPAK